MAAQSHARLTLAPLAARPGSLPVPAGLPGQGWRDRPGIGAVTRIARRIATEDRL